MRHVLLSLAVSVLSYWSLGQKLDEGLLEATKPQERNTWTLASGEAGPWTVWLEFDGGLVQQFDPNDRTIDIRRAAMLGHPEWEATATTTAVNRMTNSGFDNAVFNADNYATRGVRIGASRRIWQKIYAGIQLGQTWAPAYIQARRADGEFVVSSWHQIRYADLIDQYLYLDDLYNGSQWEYQNDSEFISGLQGWRLELVTHQELAYGLGWTASFGHILAVQQSLETKAASLYGAQGLLPPDEVSPTLAPISVVATPSVSSLGMTWRIGAVVSALTWSKVFLRHQDKNEWVSSGADPLPSWGQVCVRLGMTF